MATGFNMFLDVELVELASLITRASWANPNLEDTQEGRHSPRPVPSSLAQKTKTERKKQKVRVMSQGEALENLHKGLSTHPGSLKRSMSKNATFSKLVSSKSKLASGARKSVQIKKSTPLGTGLSDSVATLIKEESEQKTTER